MMKTQLNSTFGLLTFLLCLVLSNAVQAAVALPATDARNISTKIEIHFQADRAGNSQLAPGLLLAWQRVGSPIRLSV